MPSKMAGTFGIKSAVAYPETLSVPRGKANRDTRRCGLTRSYRFAANSLTTNGGLWFTVVHRDCWGLMQSRLLSETVFVPRKNGSVLRDRSSDCEILPEDLFLRMLSLERKRAERSSRGFVLMLLETGNLLRARDKEALERVLTALAMSIRETDIKGWYQAESVVGVIFTDVAAGNGLAVANALLEKVSTVLGKTLRIEQIREIRVSFHVFPEHSGGGGAGTQLDPLLYPELLEERNNGAISRLAKRSMDIAGSLLALGLSAPLLMAIAAAIKLTSPGPILFRQRRVGQGGRQFTFLKFRSMHAESDYSIHKEYVTQLITGSAAAQPIESAKQTVYKLTNDPRVTPLGRFLRRSSLDELPQLFNVLRGEMSLVGPRPPVPYEFECYKPWHRRRLLAVKPGITGVWQVEGRSTVKFDGMVRLDLKYARSWSPWLDLKILCRTPRVVVLGSGAY